ncbi:hypothetical protein, partial [Streptomyces albogriseolus]
RVPQLLAGVPLEVVRLGGGFVVVAVSAGPVRDEAEADRDGRSARPAHLGQQVRHLRRPQRLVTGRHTRFGT